MSEVVKFQIPKHDEDPSEGMIAFLAECPQAWDGDESGICIYSPSQEQAMIGGPGDWVVRDENGVYSIVKEGADGTQS